MGVSLIQLLQTMVQNKGSDLHIASRSQPMMRVRGEMVKFDVPALTPAETEAMCNQILTDPQKMELATKMSLDFAFRAAGVGIFRVNIFNQRHGISAVLRLLTENPPEIDDLKLPEICKSVCSQANGLVLVTGPTGSGKSTTLAAMINYINKTTKGHILTLEDPIEFQHESKLSMVNQRSLGNHFTDFASALKAALREDPDVILVGEMRDRETVELAIKAAETGHLVFSTLHTNSASKTVDRIINTFPAEDQAQIRTVLSETLRVVIAQKLVRSADRRRRICFHDVLVNTPAVANLIREGKTFQLTTVMQTGKKDGMQLIDRAIVDAVQAGEVTYEDGYEAVNEKALILPLDPKNRMRPMGGMPGAGQVGGMGQPGPVMPGSTPAGTPGAAAAPAAGAPGGVLPPGGVKKVS